MDGSGPGQLRPPLNINDLRINLVCASALWVRQACEHRSIDCQLIPIDIITTTTPVSLPLFQDNLGKPIPER